MRTRTLIVLVGVIAIVTAGCDWPMFRSGADHSGSSSEISLDANNAPALELEWTTSSGPDASSAPSVAVPTQGASPVVYSVGSGVLRAVDATGTRSCSGRPKTCGALWVSSGTGLAGTAAVNSGTVFVGSTRDVLYGFDASGTHSCVQNPNVCSALFAASGTTASTSSPRTMTDPAVAPPPNSSNPVVYVTDSGNGGGVLYAFSTTGTRLWTAATPGTGTNYSPAVASGVEYVANSDGTLAAFDAKGRLLWTGRSSHAFTSTPAVATPSGGSGPMVYVGATSELDAFGGSGCSTSPCRPQWSATYSPSLGITNFVGVPVVTPSHVAVPINFSDIGGTHNVLAAVSAGGCGATTCTLGEISPFFFGQAADLSAPAEANGIYLFTSGNTLSTFTHPDVSAGSLLYTANQGLHDPVKANDRIYVGLGNGAMNVYALRGIWHDAGPNEIANTADSSYRFATGRINPLDADSNGVIYAGSDGGGVWKSSDNGASWAPLTDQIPFFSWYPREYVQAPKVTALRVDPRNTSVVFAGLNSGEQDYGVGLFRSGDSGATWARVGWNTGVTLKPSTEFITAIRVDPSNDAYVYAALSNSGSTGVASSSDNGKTWTAPAGAIANKNVTDLDVDGSGNLFAAVPGSGIYFSPEASHGATWTALGKLPSTQSASDNLELAVARSNNQVIYAEQTAGGYLANVFRSTNAGANWTTIGTKAALCPTDSYPCGSQNIGYLAVDKTNAAIVFLGGLVDVWRTTNGTSVSPPPAWTDVTAVANTRQNGTGMHVDQHGFVQTSSGYFFANDGGIYRSTDGASTFSFVGKGLNTVQFHSGGLGSAGSGLIAGGAQDNGVPVTIPGSSWTSKLGGDGTDAFFDPGNNQNVFADINNGSAFYSTNGGQNWIESDQGPAQDNAFVLAPLVLKPGTSGSSLTLYLGAQSLWKSTNAMRSWTKQGSPGFTFHYLSANNSGKLLTSDGSTYAVSSDEGTTWPTKGTAPCQATDQCQISAVAVDPGGTLYMTAVAPQENLSFLYSSTDGGASWSQRFTAISPLHTVIADPRTPTTVYAGGNGAVFVSRQGGPFQQLGVGLPNATIYQLTVSSDGSTLAAFTLGKGVWEMPL